MCMHGRSDRLAGRSVGLLLIPPPGEAASKVDLIAAGLGRAGIRVRCPQFAAPCPGRSSSWQEWYAEAEAALTDIRRQCDVVIAGGMGTGAAMALLLAANRPQDVHATALFAPALWLQGGLQPGLAFWICMALGRRIAERVGLWPWPSRALGMPAEAFAEHRQLLQTARAALGTIRQTTLIVHSRDDCCASLDSAGYLQRHLKGMVDMAVLAGNRQAIGTVQHQFVVERALRFIEGVVGRPQAAVAARRAGTSAPASPEAKAA